LFKVQYVIIASLAKLSHKKTLRLQKESLARFGWFFLTRKR